MTIMIKITELSLFLQKNYTRSVVLETKKVIRNYEAQMRCKPHKALSSSTDFVFISAIRLAFLLLFKAGMKYM